MRWEYADYVRGSDDTQNRASSLLFGTGATLKQAAWNSALQLAGVNN